MIKHYFSFKKILLYSGLMSIFSVSAQTACSPVSSFYEDFDAYSCCTMGVVPTCWESIMLGGASQIISSTQPASGTSQIYQNGYGSGKISIVVLPEVSNINTGTHQFRFMVKANSGPGELDFGYITDITNASTFTVLETLTITNSSYTSADAERILTVPTTVPATARLAVRNPGTTWAGIYWDDARWEQSLSVKTLNNVPATIATAGGTLQLQAAIAPSTASQNVTWSVQSGSTAASVSSTGLVTALSNGTAVIRATSVADPTRHDDITITINTTIPCTPAVTLSENFENFTTFPENCWTWMADPGFSSIPVIPLVYVNQDTSVTPAAQSIAMYAFTYTTRNFYLISPAVSTINGNYILKFDAKLFSALANGSSLQVGTLDSNTSVANFNPVGNAITPTTTNQTFTSIALPATAGHQYVAIKFTPAGNHSTVLIDNVEWQKAPALPCTDPGPNTGDTGCVTFTYKGVTTTHATVRGADGNIWLQQNLGSSQTATAANDAAAYGDYFQWGRWDDGHQSSTSSISGTPPSPNNPSGLNTGSATFHTAGYNSASNWWSSGASTDTWSSATPATVTSTDGCDPCKALGTGWRLPDINELDDVLTSENITNISSAYSSNLKLTGSGMRDYSGMFVDGTRLYLWSNTASQVTNWGEYLYISPNVALTNYGDRASGIPVRCIKAATAAATVTVTTENNVPASITTSAGTLQLEATVSPAAANQNVTWTVVSGSTVVSVDNNGLVTALADGTAVVRATAVSNTSKYGELTVTVNTGTACTAVQTFLETFDNFTKFPDNCWTTSPVASPSMAGLDGTTNKTVQLYSSTSGTQDIYVVTPELTTIDGQHVLAYDVVSVSGKNATIQVGTLSDHNDFSTFTAFGAAFTPTAGKYTTSSVPATPGHKYAAIKFTPNGDHVVLKLDNIEWTTTAATGKFDTSKVKIYPNPTNGLFFIETDIEIKSVEVFNTAGQRILTTDRKQVDLNHAANGLYIVNVYANDGTHASYRLIRK